MFGTVANGTFPGCKYKVSILGFPRNFWFVLKSIAYEDQMCVKIFHFKSVYIRQPVHTEYSPAARILHTKFDQACDDIFMLSKKYRSGCFIE